MNSTEEEEKRDKERERERERKKDFRQEWEDKDGCKNRCTHGVL